MLTASSLLAGQKLFVSYKMIESTQSAFDTTGKDSFITLNSIKGMLIRATFLDEISWDVPHKNYGVKDWDKDFIAIKKMGINTVVMIRSGLDRWIAVPF